jgi:transposase
MITYQTYKEIHHLRDCEGMSFSGIASRLHLCQRTVKKWGTRKRYEPRKITRHKSILDPHKPAIRRNWELGDCSVTSIFDQLRQAGYPGGKTILNDYIRSLRPSQSDPNEQHLLSFEWMLRLVQGKLTADALVAELRITTQREDIAVLVQRVCNGSLRVRNRAVAVLAHLRNIPDRDIASFLMIDRRAVALYVRNYSVKGLAGLFAFREGTQKKHEQEKYKSAVFALLHSPPPGSRHQPYVLAHG